MDDPEQRAYYRRKLRREYSPTTVISVNSQGQSVEERGVRVPPGTFHGPRGEKASASDVTPVSSSSSFASGGGQPPNNNGWKIAAVVAGSVAAVVGAPVIASAAVVGGVVWAINSSNDSK
jgi:hypothetical protein